MTATVTDFHYGAVTPIAAYLMACLGSALGLRCTVRSVRGGPRARARSNGWLFLGAVSLGCGIWTMHFIAMIGFSIDGATVEYDTRLTVLSLLVAIVVTALGVFLVGRLGSGPKILTGAGVLMGLGVAAMHYIGMSAMRVHGEIRYDTMTVALSVLIAVAAATAALWAAVTIRGLWSSLGAALVMGIAVTGMHYTGMAAVSVHLEQGAAATAQSSVGLMSFLLAMVAGPVVVLVLAAAIVMFDPDLVLGDDEPESADASRTVPATGPQAAPFAAQAPDPAPFPVTTPPVPGPAHGAARSYDRADPPYGPARVYGQVQPPAYAQEAAYGQEPAYGPPRTYGHQGGAQGDGPAQSGGSPHPYARFPGYDEAGPQAPAAPRPQAQSPGGGGPQWPGAHSGDPR
ncbi:hypothetical protein IBX28_26175 [Streptomyces sp. SHP 1-2]|nr:hypothetical protein [Streptomyces sp. SHP 1-2]